MPDNIKTKESFGTVKINHLSPSPSEGWPKSINVIMSFEEALKLHLGLGQILGKLNGYNRSHKAGRDAAVDLCIFPESHYVTITEDRLRNRDK
jgi:hypothetical protein